MVIKNEIEQNIYTLYCNDFKRYPADSASENLGLIKTGHPG